MPSQYFLYSKKIFCEDTHELCTGYQEYLTSDHWMNLRKSILSEKSKCQKCGKSGVLQLHHVSYKNLGNETISDFMILCPDCHKKVHGKFKKKKSKSRNTNKNATIKYGKKNRYCKKKKKKKPLVFGESKLNEATAQNLVIGAQVEKFAPSCEHCFSDRGIQWCDLGYKKCPFRRCGCFKEK